jgi:hypothetical protein
MAIGVIRFQVEHAGQLSNPANPMMDYVAAHKSPADIYLIPSKLENFRLVTGAPILADFDSIPYRDVDVMIWYQRLQWVSWFYHSNQASNPCKMLMDIAANYGVTRAVVERTNQFTVCKSLPVVYEDTTYRIYELTP